MKKRVIVGWVLVAFQLIGMISNCINHGYIVQPGRNTAFYIGYFLIGIIGVILLISGYSKNDK